MARATTVVRSGWRSTTLSYSRRKKKKRQVDTTPSPPQAFRLGDEGEDGLADATSSLTLEEKSDGSVEGGKANGEERAVGNADPKW